MAIVKHLTSKNSNYWDVMDYLTCKYTEDPERGTYTPILDEYGILQERENYAIASLDPHGSEAPAETWAARCMKTNLVFRKNREKTDRKQHQYILSHPAEDRPKMTMADLMAEGKAFALANLSGYDVLIAVHRDTDNDHVHLVINSVRAASREERPWMLRDESGNVLRHEISAGGKHQDSPEFRRYCNDWLLAYTRDHGLTPKDNNAIAQQHKAERYEKANRALADAITAAAGKCRTYPELLQALEEEHIFLFRKGSSFAVLGPKNRNAVRLETLGLKAEQIPLLQQGLTQPAPPPAKDFLFEKRKYMEWVRLRREKNASRAEDALADAAALIAGQSCEKGDYQELKTLLRQTIYLKQDLETELEKVTYLLKRWEQFLDFAQPQSVRQCQERFLRWCGCDPSSQDDLDSLNREREIIALQLRQTESVQQALRETAGQWAPFHDYLPPAFQPLNTRAALSQQLAVIRANRKRLGQIAYNCQKAANRRIYNQEYLKKAEAFRLLWYKKCQEEKAVKAQLKQLKK